ncbi:MAG TPA: bifunctional diguanylate cyclase/phosphodiesterase [Burkholderiales bacterium]|nr:bifunctional diguanylate cyclase/phosphodiesterase [Burkholderiales bacterium]
MAEFLGYSAFFDRVRGAVRADRGERTLAVAVINLEFVSKVDGSYGYAAGDDLLRALALRLRDALPQGDVVGEVSRTELTCLFPALLSEQHVELAVNKVMRTLRDPVTVGGHEVYPTPLVGVSSRRLAEDDPDALLREANLAMHCARRRPEGYALYDSKNSPAERLYYELHAELHHAIEENELALFYQPLMDLRTGRIIGSEALLRWNRPGKGYVTPDKVVFVAERTGLIQPLTGWISTVALRQSGALLAEGLDVSVSVNMSVQNLGEPELPRLIARALRLWDVPPSKLILELTETAMMDENPGSLEAMLQLKELGLKLAMDDFGTGYSSMARLRDLPLDELKIDMRFVRDMLASPRDEKLVHSMIDLAHCLGMYVVAEGVETREIANRLRDMGCDVIQGYYLAKPMPMDQYREFVLARNGQPALKAEGSL